MIGLHIRSVLPVGVAAFAGVTLVAAPRGAAGGASERLHAPTPIAAKAELPRQVAIEALAAGRQREGAAELRRFVVDAFRAAKGKPGADSLPVLSAAADGVALLERLSETGPANDVTSWLIGSNERLATVARLLSPHDDVRGVCRIVEEIFRHDPDGRDAFVDLILALAVVWDQARRPLHGQTGGRAPSFEARVTERYDFFKVLYGEGRAKFVYEELTAAALVFVVDTPVPMTELAWAQKHIRGSGRNWYRYFSAIKYDKQRLQVAAFQWPHALPYTLESIQEKGGICVDQAYFAVMTARANGIPAIFFHGPGRRGGHAWFAYMTGEDRWELDVGRYVYDKYATGQAMHPQSNRPMTDHDVEYACEQSLRSSAFARAAQLANIGAVLLAEKEFAGARACARSARTAVPRYLAAWQVEYLAVRGQGDSQAGLALLEEQASVFRKYPDIQTAVRSAQAKLLRESGRDGDAEDLLRRHARKVGRERDDLARAVESGQAKRDAAEGDADAARRRMEKLLKDQVAEGGKVLGMLEEYLALTKRSGQTHEAVRFLRRYTGDLQRVVGGTAHNQRILLGILARAYTNDGDDRNAKRVRRQIDRL